MKKILILLGLFLVTNICGVDLLLPASANQLSSSNCVLILDETASSHINPAVFNSGFQTNYLSLYEIKDLDYFHFHAAKKIKFLQYYLSFTDFTFATYHEKLINTSVSFKFQQVTFGFSNRFLLLNIENYSNEFSYINDFGLLWKSRKITTAFAIKNIFQASLRKSKIPINYIFESSYSLNKSNQISIKLEKENNHDFIPVFATRTSIKIIDLIAGYQFEPNIISAGFNLRLKKIAFSYGMNLHQYLDTSFSISFRYH